MNWSAVKVIYKKELKSYFSTPVGYVFLVIFLFAIGHATFELGRGSFFYLREANLNSFFRYIPWLFLFLVPAVSMRLWAEERKTGTIELLLTMPITVREAVVAKFFASWTFLGISLLGTLPIVFTVTFLGSPDFGHIVLGYVGSFLLAGAFLAIGCFFSGLTKNQVVSFILSTVFCYLFLMAGSPPILEFLSSFSPKYVLDVFESLSILNHFESMARGVIGLGDVWFFMIMVLGWLVGCIFLVEDRKAS